MFTLYWPIFVFSLLELLLEKIRNYVSKIKCRCLKIPGRFCVCSLNLQPCYWWANAQQLSSRHRLLNTETPCQTQQGGNWCFSWRCSRTALTQAGRLLNDIFLCTVTLAENTRINALLFAADALHRREACLGVYRWWDAHFQSQTNHCWAVTALHTRALSLFSISLSALHVITTSIHQLGKNDYCSSRL